MVIGSGILGTLNDTGTLLLVMAVVMCFAGAANALNDVVDYEIDKIIFIFFIAINIIQYIFNLRFC